MRKHSGWCLGLVAAALLTSGQAQAGYKESLAWFGVGVRFAPPVSMHLTTKDFPAVDEFIDMIRDSADDFGYDIPASDFDAKFDTGWMIVPTFHLGGDGLSARIDLPFSISDSYTSAGLGLYPIGFNVFIPEVHLMPYAYAGVGLSAMVVNGTFSVYANGTDTGLTEQVEQIGGMADARVTAGLRFFTIMPLALSLEVTWIPYSAGVLMNMDRFQKYTDGDQEAIESYAPQSVFRGGLGEGSTFMVSFGAEWW